MWYVGRMSYIIFVDLLVALCKWQFTFRGRMVFLLPNQQYLNTEVIIVIIGRIDMRVRSFYAAANSSGSYGTIEIRPGLLLLLLLLSSSLLFQIF